MKRFFKTSLALIFALLQCIAPVAHAHINGGSVDKGIHLPELRLQHGHGVSQLSNADTAQESPSIVASQGFERWDTPLSSAGQTVIAPRYMALSAQTRTILVALSPRYSTPPPPAAFSTPYPQAPPALS